jgi:hypothetical protein
METAPQLLADDAPVVIDVVPPTPSPPPDSEADGTRLTSPLSPTLTPVVPALSVETLTASKLVSVPMPEAMAMEPQKVVNLPTPPVTDKAPPDVEPIPDASYRVLPLPLDYPRPLIVECYYFYLRQTTSTCSHLQQEACTVWLIDCHIFVMN